MREDEERFSILFLSHSKRVRKRARKRDQERERERKRSEQMKTREEEVFIFLSRQFPLAAKFFYSPRNTH